MTEPKAPQKTDYIRLGLLGLFALALALRLYGIGWALPNSARLFSYHPDESIVTGAALAIRPFQFQFDPHFYNYGSLSLILDAWAIQIGRLAGFSGPLLMGGQLPSAGDLLAARLITALLGTLTCGFVYGMGRLLYGRYYGLIAAGLYAIAPLAVQHAHWATVDIPATFWVSGGLYFAVRAASPERRKIDLVWCGLYIGLAAATKYNAGVALLAGVAAAVLQKRVRRPAATLAVVFASLAGFLVGCPAALTNPGGLVRGIRYEANHVATGQDEAFRGTVSGFIYHVGVNLNWGLTLPLLLCVIAGLGGALWRAKNRASRRPGELILLLFLAPYYLLIGAAQVKFARYTLPILPPLFVLTAGLLHALVDAKRTIPVRIASVCLAAASLWAALFALALDRTMTMPDTRDQAAAYIKQQVFPSVGFATGPWFFSPPLGPYLAAPVPAVARRSARDVLEPILLPANDDWTTATHDTHHGFDWDTARIVDPACASAAISEYEYTDPIRLHDPAAAAFLDTLKRTYRTRMVFALPVEILGIRFTNTAAPDDELPRQKMPHDMLYTNPTTVVYSR